MPEARPPSRIVLVFSGLFTQLIGAACLVLGLASFPIMHDLHRPLHVVAGWVAAALGALLFGGLSYRARIVPLGLAAIIDAGFGFALPRKDSALGALAQLLPQGDVELTDTIVSAVAIGMFVVAALCIVSIPFAVRYRRWEATDEGIRLSRSMVAMTAADTLKGVGPTTMVIHTSALQGKSRPWVIFFVAATLVGTGVAVIAVGGIGAHHGRHGAGSGSAVADTGHGSAVRVASTPGPDAGTAALADGGAAAPDAAPAKPAADGAASPQELATALHDALAHGDRAALTALFAPDVIAAGVEATELADGRDAAVALIGADIGSAGAVTVEPDHTTIGHDGKIAWIAEELAITAPPAPARRFVTSAIASESGGRWTIAAVDWAVAVPNDTAFRLARDHKLPVPSPIADHTGGASELAEAARTAFGSHDGFTAARSKRADAFNFGSAPGERMVGGEGIRRAFAHMAAQISLHDGLAAGMLGDHAGWTMANVDFVAPDHDRTPVPQTFRVLAGWIREDAGWRIVHTQFSNPRPLLPAR